jgi:hypothetical protein
MKAHQQDHREIVRLLLAAGADNINDPVLPTAVVYTVVRCDAEDNALDPVLPSYAVSACEVEIVSR